jgi:N,N'-diacetyllegionaminate synthase
VPGNAPCFVIAEIGVNHNGDVGLALELIDVAAEMGADAAKFQTFNTAKLVRPEAEKADYQKQRTGDGSQDEMLQKLELSEADHEKLSNHCRSRKIEFMSTPFDLEAADFLRRIGVQRMKLPSGDIDNVPMIRRMASFDIPVIVSTGMAELSEVRAAKQYLEIEWARLGLMADRPDRLTILHCTSNYPAAPEDVNIDAMLTLGRELDCPVGYSDHTEGTAVSIAAVALGATVIEKHITLDKNMTGPDHAASLDPSEFSALVKSIRTVEAARGDGIKAPRSSEISVRALVRRSISIARDLAPGVVVTAEDLVMLRPANGIPASRIDEVIGRKTSRSLGPGTLLVWEDLT